MEAIPQLEFCLPPNNSLCQADKTKPSQRIQGSLTGRRRSSCGGQRHSVGIGLLSPLCRLQGLNSGCRAWGQVPSPPCQLTASLWDSLLPSVWTDSTNSLNTRLPECASNSVSAASALPSQSKMVAAHCPSLEPETRIGRSIP